MSERYAVDPGPAWTELTSADDRDVWAAFEARYGFRAGMTSEAWPRFANRPHL